MGLVLANGEQVPRAPLWGPILPWQEGAVGGAPLAHPPRVLRGLPAARSGRSLCFMAFHSEGDGPILRRPEPVSGLRQALEG